MSKVTCPVCNEGAIRTEREGFTIQFECKKCYHTWEKKLSHRMKSRLGIGMETQYPYAMSAALDSLMA